MPLLEKAARVQQFNLLYPQEKVYLHFDNTGYFIGETIWFKAYVVRADTGKPTDLSGVLYVELLNAAGDVVERRKLEVEEGQARGDIRLDKLLPSGFYEVRAYTRYMTNWGTGACFSRGSPFLRNLNVLAITPRLPLTVLFPVTGYWTCVGKKSMRTLPKQREESPFLYGLRGHTAWNAMALGFACIRREEVSCRDWRGVWLSA